MKPIPAYPLQWPDGWKRSQAQADGRFGKRKPHAGSSYATLQEVTIADGVGRVRTELDRMGLSDDDIVISTNLVLRLDGLPRSDQRQPDDAGAAVYWRNRAGETKCIAIDRYARVADNLAAIAATLNAMRAIERHGGAEILDRAFTEFTTLPTPEGKPWHIVLSYPAHASTDHVRRNYQRARSTFHPDKGGDANTFNTITSAWESFCAERGIQS
jgi:hypothetical protein